MEALASGFVIVAVAIVAFGLVFVPRDRRRDRRDRDELRATSAASVAHSTWRYDLSAIHNELLPSALIGVPCAGRTAAVVTFAGSFARGAERGIAAAASHDGKRAANVEVRSKRLQFRRTLFCRMGSRKARDLVTTAETRLLELRPILGDAVENLHAFLDLFLSEQSAGEQMFHSDVRWVGLQNRAVNVVCFPVLSVLAEGPSLMEQFRLVVRFLVSFDSEPATSTLLPVDL